MKPIKPARPRKHVAPLTPSASMLATHNTVALSRPTEAPPEAVQAPQRPVIRTVERGDGLPPILFTAPRVVGPLVVHVGRLEWGVPLGSRVARSIKKNEGRISYVLTPAGEVHVLE